MSLSKCCIICISVVYIHIILLCSSQELSVEGMRRILNTIQSSIQKKDEEMAWIDSCCLQLAVKGKSNKEEIYTFQTDNPVVKKEWITGNDLWFGTIWVHSHCRAVPVKISVLPCACNNFRQAEPFSWNGILGNFIPFSVYVPVLGGRWRNDKRFSYALF